MKTVLLFLIAAILILLIGVSLMQMPICKGRIFPALSPWIQMIFPPDDLYDSLYEYPLDLSAEGATHTFTFTNIYAGRHAISLILEDLSMYSKSNAIPQFSIAFTFSTSNQGQKQAMATNLMYKFWGAKQNGGAIFRYSTPGDLPIDQPVNVTLNIERADSAFQSKHGPNMLRIGKESEE